MTTFLFAGTNSSYFIDAFFSASGDFDPDVVSASSTTIILNNPDTGITTTVSGSGFVFAGPPGDEEPVAGTITSLVMRSAGSRLEGTVTDINWNIVTLSNALENAAQGNLQFVANLLNASGPITIDAIGARGGLNMYELFDPDLSDLISQPMTILGSERQDFLYGGLGNDSIVVGADDGDFNGGAVDLTRGNDTIDFSGVSNTTYQWLDGKDFVDGPVTYNVDAVANTGTVSGLGFLTTLLDVQRIIEADGLGLEGGEVNDVFNVVISEDGYVELAGREGNDTFNLTLHGTVRVYYDFGSSAAPSTGIVANLATGIISNDGFGGQDTINILGGDGSIQIRDTLLNDLITGSNRDELYILSEGVDTLDAGGGFDILRYNFDNIGAVSVNLPLGRVTGTWDGNGFTHLVSNVERFLGSLAGNDTMLGDAGDNDFFGRGGDDSLVGGAGNDDLEGDEGNDTLIGGEGEDYLWGGDGDDFLDAGNSDTFAVADGHSGVDTVDAGSMQDGTLVIEHFNLVDAGFGQVITVTTTNSTVEKGGTLGTTTVINSSGALTSEFGLRFRGGDSDDVFNISLTPSTALSDLDDALVSVVGGVGNDSFNLNGSTGGAVLFSYQNDNTYTAATQSVVANLQTGVVSNDGFGGNDTITNANGIMTGLEGSALNDTLTGSAGNDFFLLGAGGNDVVDGGAGDEDEVLYLFADAGVEVDLAAGTATGDGFTQSLTGIEAVTGSDYNDTLSGGAGESDLTGGSGDDVLYGDGFDIGTVAAVSAQVYRLYEALLSRTADYGGHADWTTRIVEGTRTVEEVAAGFTGSNEFRNVFGDATTTTAAEFVDLLFQNVLGRPAGPGAQNWVNAIEAGVLTREEVALAFSDGDESINNTRAASTSFTEARSEAVWLDDIFRLYQATLDRNPDRLGLENWTTNLGNGQDFQTVVSGFVNSTEFQNRYGATTDSQFVTLLYNNVLGRTPSAGELQDWLDRITGGETREKVVELFSQSSEFRNNTAASLEAYVRGLGVDDVLEGGTGNNTLIGGIFSDEFVFDADQDGSNTVTDLEAWDTLVFEDFGYLNQADVRANMTQVGDDVVFADQGVTVTLQDVALGDITDSMILPV